MCNIRMRNPLVVVFCLLITLSSVGCSMAVRGIAAITDRGATALNNATDKTETQLITLLEPPAWLIISKQEPETDVVRIKDSLSLKDSPYKFKTYDNNDPLIIQFLPDNVIAYLGGSGEIIKINTNERVVLPFKSTR